MILVTPFRSPSSCRPLLSTLVYRKMLYEECKEDIDARQLFWFLLLFRSFLFLIVRCSALYQLKHFAYSSVICTTAAMYWANTLVLRSIAGLEKDKSIYRTEPISIYRTEFNAKSSTASRVMRSDLACSTQRPIMHGTFSQDWHEWYVSVVHDIVGWGRQNDLE